uniref:Major facilitator superfamily (MFS) profile domain-containing protein n=1 Tax=Lepeophtheirus salmonis TaxID=72036 RepID=A0A0K2ULF2_LEPSM
MVEQDFELLQEGDEEENSDLVQFEEESSWSLIKRLGAGASCGFLLGFETVVFVGLRPLVQSELGISCFALENLLSFFPLALMGTPLVLGSQLPKHLQNFSKLPFFLFCGILFVSSGLLVIRSANLYSIFFGQLLAGVGISGLILLHMEYLVNISTPIHRGKTVGSIQLGVGIGVTFAHLMDIIFSSTPGGYKYAFVFLPVVASILVVIFVAIQDPLPTMNTQIPFKKGGSLPWILGGGLVILQQCSGEPNVLYYAKEIFERLGFCDGVRASSAAFSVSFVQIVASGISLFLVDRMGRRLILIFGTLAMTLSTGLLSIEELSSGREWEPPICRNNYTFNYDAVPETCNEESPKKFEVIVLISLVFYVFSYSMSLGTVSWILISELSKCVANPFKFIGWILSINWMCRLLIYETFYEATSIV